MALNSKYEDEELLTASLDKTIKLTNITQGRLIHSYECSAPVWSCCFNTDNPLYFYAGLANGQVLLFDKRKIDSHVLVVNADFNSGAPVGNLNYASRDHSNMSFRSAGLIVSQHDKVSYFEKVKDDEYKYSPLLFEANIMSCYLEPSTRHMLVSTRPSARNSQVRHLVYEFMSSSNSDGPMSHSLNLLQCFSGSNVQKLLARSKLFCMDGQLYGAAPCESAKSALVWDAASNELCAKLSSASDIIDVCSFQHREQHFMCTLTDKQLRIFRKT
jgi:E3 ubiquitin-protein ligase RFWD3